MPNPYLDDNDEDETDQSGSESANFKQLRDYAKKMERQAAAHAKELEQLRGFKAEVESERRGAAVAQVFKKVGLSEKHSALFAKLNPEGDVTEEVVAAFAQEYELPRSAPSAASAEDGEAPQKTDWATEQIVEVKQAETQAVGFAPVQGTGLPSGQIITDAEEAIKLSATNPAEYARLYQAGRIKLEKLPGSAPS